MAYFVGPCHPPHQRVPRLEVAQFQAMARKSKPQQKAQTQRSLQAGAETKEEEENPTPTIMRLAKYRFGLIRFIDAYTPSGGVLPVASLLATLNWKHRTKTVLGLLIDSFSSNINSNTNHIAPIGIRCPIQSGNESSGQTSDRSVHVDLIVLQQTHSWRHPFPEARSCDSSWESGMVSAHRISPVLVLPCHSRRPHRNVPLDEFCPTEKQNLIVGQNLLS
ncbi:malate dehydrogenase (nad) [Anopheles sinensis]|uniref:Malate dehydrogenase (Nad) n=1 Tax=Anopheles sinensis TaxID=74873 RepID=A0A084VTT1_ANOSI|nr:malate dehydrogenase (nad) [Anopheles sinensis]